MCIGAGTGSKLPPTPPLPTTLVDPAVQAARSDAQRQVQNSGLDATTLNINLGGQGQGSKKLAGSNK
jgi:hypothetical protein